MDGDAPRLAFRQLGAPASLLGGKFQHRFVARMMGQQRPAEFDRVLAGRMGQFVDEDFGRIGGVGAADRPPPQHRHADLGRVQFDRDVRDVVGQIGRTLDRGAVDSVLDHDGSNGVPPMIDWPTMRCCHATGLPCASRPAVSV